MPQYLKLKEHYEYTCWKCGDGKNVAQPSMFMTTFQLNLGGSQCPVCKESMKLTIDDKNERMISSEHKSGSVRPLPDACYEEREAPPVPEGKA